MKTNDNNPVTHEGVCRSKLWRPDGDTGAEIGQEPVASFIASEVMRDPDIRIALEGPWGSGKTRILSLIQKTLERPENKDVVVAWYDPWKYSPDETVLRRTLLDAIGCAVNEQCSECKGKVNTDRYHKEVEQVKQRPVEEQINNKEAFKSIWTLLKNLKWFYLSFAVLWTLSYFGAIWLQDDIPQLGKLPTIFVSTIGIILLTALIKDAVQTIQLVQYSPYIKTTLPKLDQIDQFEAEYCSVMTCLNAHNKNLVVLVDDIDRCNDKEIRTVMSGLTTYMEAPHDGDTGRVAFVVAMDENKIVGALHGDNSNTSSRQNIIQKHFHIVVPVPYPTDTVLLKVLNSTLEELNWKVPEKDRRRMTHLISIHAKSNLRILRSTTTEAYSIERYYTEVLEPQGIKVADELIKDPMLRFRVALIREITPSNSLREYLSDPGVWLGKGGWPPGIQRQLFETDPAFTRDQLDPRPLFGFAQGMMLASVAPEMNDVITVLKDNRQEQLNHYLDSLQPEAVISLVSMIIAARLPTEPPAQVGNLISGLVGMLHRVRDFLDHRDLSTFKLLAEHLQNFVQPSQLPSTGYLEWINVAASIGVDALDGLFRTDFILLKPPHQPQMLEQLLQSAIQYGSVDGRLAYQLYARIVGKSNWEVLLTVASRLVKAGKLSACQELHELQIDCMEKWNYGQKPDGPPKELYTKNLIQGMDENLHARAAKAYQIVVNQQSPQTRQFATALPSEWPTGYMTDTEGE